MKRKRFGALALSLALLLSLAAIPAQATEAPGTDVPKAAFSDIENHWARDFIEDMARRGYANGEGEKFYPDRTMSALETILFCARVTNVDKATQEHIAADRKEAVDAMLPERTRSWASAEVALALETGVISVAELEALNQIAPGSLDYSGGPQPSLLWNISRENVFMYLVRAMQLEPLARSFSPEVCSAFLRGYYADADQISPLIQPYIYVLTYYKILEGSPSEEGKNVIRPKDFIKRGEMMKIVSLALSVMDTLDIHTELSEYTDHDWAAGTVVSLDSQLSDSFKLTLQSEISGTRTYDLPGKVNIYRNNMRITDNVKSLAVGDYVRLNFDAEGKTVESVRVSGAPAVYTGKVSLLDTESNKIILTQEGASRSVIDPLAGYTDAVCYVNDMGALVGLKLSGGTVQITGLLQGMTVNTDGSTALTLAAFDGVPTVYTVPAAATILVNDVQGILAPAYVGRHTTLRVTEGTKSVASVAVDTLTTYLQGRIVRQGAVGAQKTLTIADALDFNQEKSNPMDPGAFITYAGEERTADRVEAGWFVTARLVGGVIVELTGYPSSTEVTGVLSSIRYGATTVLTLTLPDGGSTAYELDINDLPAITRSGKKATIDQLRTGDTLILTLRYNEVREIAATPQEANLTGSIQGISTSTTGSEITVKLSDGTVETYAVGVGVSVTRNGATATFRDLNVGDAVALVTSGGELLSIDITALATTEGQLMGEVYTVTNIGNTRSISLIVEGRDTPVTVDLRAKSAVIQDRTGAALSISKLAAGDRVLVLGSYDGPVFVATLVTKL